MWRGLFRALEISSDVRLQGDTGFLAGPRRSQCSSRNCIMIDGKKTIWRILKECTKDWTKSSHLPGPGSHDYDPPPLSSPSPQVSSFFFASLIRPYDCGINKTFLFKMRPFRIAFRVRPLVSPCVSNLTEKIKANFCLYASLNKSKLSAVFYLTNLKEQLIGSKKTFSHTKL